MKWIGQHIVDFIARFRSDVYLEGVAESAQDHVVGIDADGKLYKQDVSVGDITAVTITTDNGGHSAASDTSGSADFSILGGTGVNVTNSGTTITATAVPGEIDHDSLQNFVAEEHVDWAGSSAGTIHSSNIPTLNQNTTGSAATLTTPRAINGVNFDGSAPITVTAAGSTLSDTVTVAKGGTGATSFTSNALLTGNTTSAIQAEANAIYDGADLSLTSSTSGKPILTIENSNTDAVSPIIKLAKTATGANNDEIGRIQFEADDNADNPTVFAEIKGEIQDANNSGTSEDGQLELLIAQGASLVNVLKANSNSGLGTILEFGDGSMLSMTTFKSTIVNFESATTTAPIFTSKNTTADAGGPQFTFVKDRGGAAGVGSTSDGDNCGLFNFRGYDAGGNSTTYAWIESTAVTTSSGNEAGKIEVKVTSDGSTTANNRNVITGTGHTTVDKVDVDLGYGATSTVTVPGNISIGGHSVNDIDVAGEFVDSDEHLMTSAAINDRIAAVGGGGGGGTSYWHQVVPGYKTSWNSASNYYTFYRGWYENWSNSDSSPGTVSYTDYYAHIFVAPRAGTITNVKISGTVTGATYDDPFKFYFYKTGSSSNQGTVTLTSMFNTSAITPPGNAKTWSHTEDFSSSNTFAEDDRIFVWIKKDSTAGATSCYWTINVNGEYS
jgi:hypothetical protein